VVLVIECIAMFKLACLLSVVVSFRKMRGLKLKFIMVSTSSTARWMVKYRVTDLVYPGQPLLECEHLFE